MALRKPRPYRLREDQYQWLSRKAEREGDNISLALRKLIDEAIKAERKGKRRAA